MISDKAISNIYDIIDDKKFLSRKGKKRAKKRIIEIPDIIEKVSKYDFKLKKDIDFSRLDFMGALEKYLLGFYYESIQSAINSIEIGLTVKLNETLTKEDKDKIYGSINQEKKPLSFTFGYVKHLSVQYKIIKDEHIINKINDIIKKRNILFHPITFLTGLINKEKEILIPMIDEFIGENKYLEFFPIYKKMTGVILDSRNVVDELTIFKWCTPEKNLIYIESEIDEYINVMTDKINEYKKSVKKDFKNILKIKSIINEVKEEGYIKYSARKTLIDAYEILEYLEVI